MSMKQGSNQYKNKKLTDYFSSKDSKISDKDQLEDKPMKKSKNQVGMKSIQSTNSKSDSDTEIAEEIKKSSSSLDDQKNKSPSKHEIIEKKNVANTIQKVNDTIEQQNKIQQEEEQKQSNESNNQSIEKKQLRSHSQKLKNLQFYLNNLQSNPNGDYIQNILEKWKGKFKLLETHHGYVQWLFPNFFQSRFNNGSDPLQQEEAEEFIKNPVIANRLKKAYDLIYEFFGMKIVNNITGEVQRADNYKERYHETFITSYHNHMRIRRILCHFNNVGFRRYAISLVKFLEKEIYGEKGYQKFAEDKRPLVLKWQELPQTIPLRQLSRLKVFEEWQIYGEIDENNQLQVETLQDNCFATIQDIKRESIYLRNLKEAKHGVHL
ncbi:opioid growth factor receptor (macronuclear) [Tetrahymena thermophila SB210]|uniref:Opioid growth factor receptor n=1 Tax=Tetrahymena thermophila (strain SB210) TaxID=312017 RepID=Q24GQ7_TETTS|nr:opioid growth factor receptor [Tetrahymena thermophila SB210]EAS06950.1 opioid growth factor receptor [Tetrahymena thermophila SB210]|eukprot:XP_001027192.1 opioid growth factor receptor [Tetrahymena thermophila SB210]